MDRRFRFRVREGHEISTYGDNPERHGPGYEFVLDEKDAANVLRSSHGRRAYKRVGVLTDAATTPPSKPPALD
jgi:hypothetical protein